MILKCLQSVKICGWNLGVGLNRKTLLLWLLLRWNVLAQEDAVRRVACGVTWWCRWSASPRDGRDARGIVAVLVGCCPVEADWIGRMMRLGVGSVMEICWMDGDGSSTDAGCRSGGHGSKGAWSLADGGSLAVGWTLVAAGWAGSIMAVEIWPWLLGDEDGELLDEADGRWLGRWVAVELWPWPDLWASLLADGRRRILGVMQIWVVTGAGLLLDGAGRDDRGVGGGSPAVRWWRRGDGSARGWIGSSPIMVEADAGRLAVASCGLLLAVDRGWKSSPETGRCTCSIGEDGAPKLGAPAVHSDLWHKGFYPQKLLSDREWEHDPFNLSVRRESTQ
ncbi:hypothetical protein ACLOJK_014663 [Asimina triloba]